jgi:hypothetical protein
VMSSVRTRWGQNFADSHLFPPDDVLASYASVDLDKSPACWT